MNRRTIWLCIGGFVLMLLASPLYLGLILTASEGEIDRYRTAIEVTIADGDRIAGNKVYADCTVTRHHGWNTGTQVGTSHRGDRPFVVVADRSILILTDLSRCRDGKVGESFTFDPDVPYDKAVDRRVNAPYAHAHRYDNVDDAKVLTLYSQQQLFRKAIDGVRVTGAKLVIVERHPTSPLPVAFADAFPWYKNTPRADVSSEDYTRYDYGTRFSGFIVRLNQLGEKQRCEKFDREAEGPILVIGDRWDTCPPWGAQNLGWLIARPNADLSQIDYSYDQRSHDLIAKHYRATWLEASGAPGVKQGENYFFWRPRLCFDGRCFETHADRKGLWAGFRLYYPKKNQVISAEWVH